MQELIGFSGYARVGNDTAANILVEEYGFTRLAFADALRNALYALNPIVAKVNWHEGYEHLQEIINYYGWDGYKSTPYSDEIRRLLQRFGTDAGRNIIGQNVWVQATLENLPGGKYVVTDCRFPNEAEYITERYDGIIIRVERPGIGPINDHYSEVALDDCDFYCHLKNDGNIGQLRKSIKEVYEKWMK
jgi:hypothetical protein